ncbi:MULTISPECIES: carbamate kinase [Clostridium]|jgi:carbamate kinase|uniref:Carbamate kinase n=1 Tax=Clostridium cochlearium TaxID=1494 RepID=A0ABY0QMX4_CLOCO|nr:MULTISPECIES: carbamate kinase [Clostridium]MBV1819237.1 carbamate kinase [Bacteroidales bacterium MSK.15.36]NSJ91322.1 carbamate kinase [Coprococcus sp. MSK.21.13]MBE6044024.1 carbamate kinase [Clostridium thermopalmarium]MBE6064956.1 carbamate kinase [Clostridium cochlearium]MBU5270457.1 carbamate kinase [Clostridium cochlearium]
MNKKTIVVALGGNAILQPGQFASYENQLNNVKISCEVLAKLVKQGHRLIITHGNGPQVGNIIRQNEEAASVIPPMPMDVCSAESQGFIGYMIQQSMMNELINLGVETPVVTFVTRVEVDEKDSAFENPTKPIGMFYSEDQAKELMREKQWILKSDANRGWRRVVPSPNPVSIVEKKSIKKLIEEGNIVIACGGGGIPVVKCEDGTYKGVEAVIDKDRSGCKLAEQAEADMFIILTDVENACINYGKEDQKALGKVSVEELERYIENGEFSKGSMLPKVESAVEFVKKTNGISIICALDKAELAIEGKAGTIVKKS